MLILGMRLVTMETIVIQVSEPLDIVFRDMYTLNKPLRSPRSVTKVGEEPENKATRNITRTLERPMETEAMFPGLRIFRMRLQHFT